MPPLEERLGNGAVQLTGTNSGKEKKKISGSVWTVSRVPGRVLEAF